MMSEFKRNRSSNFTEQEMRCLVSSCAKNGAILCGKLGNSVANGQKREVWDRITNMINSISSTHRSMASCKKKWVEMKAAAIKCRKARKDKLNDGMFSGPEEPWFVEDILNIIGQNEGDTGEDETGIYADEKMPDDTSSDNDEFGTDVRRPTQSGIGVSVSETGERMEVKTSCSPIPISSPRNEAPHLDTRNGHMRGARESHDYNELLDAEITKLRTETCKLQVELDLLREKKRKFAEKEELQRKILVVQLRKEEQTVHKQSLEIRLLEKQLHIKSTTPVPAEPQVNLDCKV